MNKIKLAFVLLFLCFTAFSKVHLGDSIHCIVEKEVYIDFKGPQIAGQSRNLTLSGVISGKKVNYKSSDNCEHSMSVYGKFKGKVCGAVLDTTASTSKDWFLIGINETIEIEGYFTNVKYTPEECHCAKNDFYKKFTRVYEGKLIGEDKFTDVHLVEFLIPVINANRLNYLNPEVSGNVNGHLDLEVSHVPGFDTDGVARIVGTVNGNLNGKLLFKTAYTSSVNNPDIVDLYADISGNVNVVVYDMGKDGDSIGVYNGKLDFGVTYFDVMDCDTVEGGDNIRIENDSVYDCSGMTWVDTINQGFAKIYSGVLGDIDIQVTSREPQKTITIKEVSWCKDDQLWNDSDIDSMLNLENDWVKLPLSESTAMWIPKALALSSINGVSEVSALDLNSVFFLNKITIAEANYLVVLEKNGRNDQTLLSKINDTWMEAPHQFYNINGNNYALYSVSSSSRYFAISSSNADPTAVEPELKGLVKQVEVSVKNMSINLKAPEEGLLKVALYDLHGRRISQIHSGFVKKGAFSLPFDNKIAQGNYILHISLNNIVTVKGISFISK